jgi:Tfp pilus assembly protein PilF
MCSDANQADHVAALELWERGSQRQMERDLDGAEQLYRQSIELHPTAEAWTFLGWVASWRGDPEKAIECCQRAIEVDPTFGNPYNDIGAYLIELDRAEQAIPWLQRAIEAPRYEARVFPWMNLGRVYERLGRFKQAVEHYRNALKIEPRYVPVIQALDRLLSRRNGQVKVGTDTA